MTDLARPDAPATTVPERTGVIQWNSLPRRIVTVYTPLVAFLIVLLFPFYWMTITTFKSNEELYNCKEYNPFWIHSPTLENVNRLLFQTDYPQWLTITMTVAVVATAISLFASVLAAYAIQRLRFKGGSMSAWRSTSPIWCRPRSCSSRWPPWSSSSGCTTARWR